MNRFISRLGEKALPLYRLMKKSTHFEWNAQADQAFHEMKKMLTTPPVLAAPTEKECQDPDFRILIFQKMALVLTSPRITVS